MLPVSHRNPQPLGLALLTCIAACTMGEPSPVSIPTPPDQGDVPMGVSSVVDGTPVLTVSPRCFHLEFDGKDDASTPANIDLDLGNQGDHDFTIELWFRGTPSVGNTQALVSRADRDYGLLMSDGQLVFRINASGCNEVIVSEPAPGLWHHIAGVVTPTAGDTGNLSLFVDGHRVGQCTYTDKVAAMPADLHFGQSLVAGDGYEGDLGSIRISDIARYNEGFAPTSEWVADADTIALWDLDEGSGDIAWDATHNGHNLDVSTTQWTEDDDCDLAVDLWFQEMTTHAGIDHHSGTWGCSWADFDGDGDPDIYVNNHKSDPLLYINEGDDLFSLSNRLIVDDPGYDSHGSAWADFDNDGDLDLAELVGAGRGADPEATHLYVNDGQVLQDAAHVWGLGFEEGRGRTPLWLDWNNDGQLDLIQATFFDAAAPTTLFLQSTGVFIQDEVLSDVSVGYSQLGDLDGDGRLDLALGWSGFPSILFRNTGTGYVPMDDLDVPSFLWVEDTAIADFDGDLRNDVFTVRRGPFHSQVVQVDPNTLGAGFFFGVEGEIGFTFVGEHAVTFEVNPYELWAQTTTLIGAGGHSPISVNGFTLDPNNPDTHGIPTPPPTGDYTLIGFDPPTSTWTVLAFFEMTSSRYLMLNSPGFLGNAQPIGFSNPDISSPDYRNDNQDTLLLWDGVGYAEHREDVGLGEPTSCWSIGAADFDNDMDVDVYLVCADALRNAPNRLYENLGDGTFARVDGAGRATGSTLGFGESICLADYDTDGFMDLFITNGDRFSEGPHELFHNVGNANHWVEIDLVGTTSNIHGIGARVLVTTAGVTQLREQNGGMHMAVQHHPRLHIGLGSNESIDTIEINWPSGITQILTDVDADQLITVVEP